ncbi:MAG: hypothetical protein HYX82_05100 [Chloroflexi bacterium]|nr:hypothetical protein [Chloroflexota bacterium]
MQQKEGTLGRRLFHIVAGSVFPTLAIFLPEMLILTLLAVLAAVMVLAELVRFVSPTFNRWFIRFLRILLKEKEFSQVTGATYLALSSFLAFLVFDKEVAILSLFFLSLGDPVAALVGQRFGKHRVFKKSLEGALAFFATSIAIGLAVGLISLGVRFPVVVSGAVFGALIEVLPIPIDDNVTIPILSGALMSLVGLL